VSRSALERLCALEGIAPDYFDIWGNRHVPADETRIALLQAMGVLSDASGVEAALSLREERQWRRAVPPVAVLREEALPYRWEICCEERLCGRPHRWRLALESGETRQADFRPGDLRRVAAREIDGVSYVRHAFEWHDPLPLGYHRFMVESPEGASPGVLALIVTPARCYTPPALAANGRAWGPALQLYAVRSARNWGIGDFTDLRNAIEFAGRAGAGIVGVNPLHALVAHDPDRISPYSPSSRIHLNVLYLDVEAVPEFTECEATRSAFAAPEFQSRLRALRDQELVDYRGVAQVKLTALGAMYDHFRARHLLARTERGESFLAWQRAGGEPLLRYALFQSLQEHFHARHQSVWGWPVWPERYRDPTSPEVDAYLAANRAHVEFHAWLQWLAEEQLADCGRRSWELGLGVGLYQDLAVSVDRAGAETWAWQGVYAEHASIGSPPDDFNLNGQNWGLPPPIPEALTESAYAPFVATLRANMRHAGALRVDHVMGLMRLFWIPPDGRPADGGYVHYPFADLLGVLALESWRNRCLVIGEDLGTVPDAVREALAPLGVLSYRVLMFEKENGGGFKPPASYPAQALAAASTHDLPTLKSFWSGRDLDLRARLGLYPSEAHRERQVVARAEDRARLLVALEREGLLPAGATVHPVSAPEMTPELALAIHVFLAHSPARVTLVQMEDVLGQLEQVNLPATSTEYPNWRRKLPLDLEEWCTDARVAALAQAMRIARGAGATVRAAAAEARPRRAAVIPRATYRLQFSREFTFRRAAEIVPYLARLGISHAYCSPYLRARAGSLHGYDIVDHRSLNPEVGSPEDFEAFAGALRRHGMGQIVDVVPNHMGVMGADNEWWLDVLENGPSSPHAAAFDIDWQPVNAELANRVLVPVLGDHYGSVLERGELRVIFDAGRGAFSICYNEHRFPVDPREYQRILQLAIGAGEAHGLTEEARVELSGLAAAFGHLPARDELAPERVAERRRDKELLGQRLPRVIARLPETGQAIGRAVEMLNGTVGRRASFRQLHELLEAQAYRLAYWRVASDEINYRRFFDINTLAALRMENEAVFEATHRFVLELAAAGTIDGLRIDHVDGLYDPAQYFHRLQTRYAQLAGLDPGAAQGGRPDRPLYVVAEKITAHHEDVPQGWALHGTTGYRFASVVNGLFVDGTAKRRFDRIYRAFSQEAGDFEAAAYEAKTSIMRTALASELTVLATELLRIARADWRTRDYTFNTLRRALAGVVACFPVYRTYIAQHVSEQDRRYIDWAVAQSRRRSRDADASLFEFVRNVLVAKTPADAPPELAPRCLRFAAKFQQFTAPVAAKGVEDTAFYRYHRLISLNEVGSDPRTFGISVNAFHQASLDRARNWPHTMLAGSTHDAKRSADMRMRVDALTELPREWADKLRRWRRITRGKQRRVEGIPAPSANDEYLIYQTLLGTWPAPDPDAAALQVYQQRIASYLVKAAREAKVHTSWMNVNEEYEAAISGFVGDLLQAPERNAFLADFVPFARRVARIGMFNSLSEIVIRTCSPGVPDFYQGSELWQLHLVDPDNRGAIDYSVRERWLAEFHEWPEQLGSAPAHGLLERLEDGRGKLYVTWKSLLARREQAHLFVHGGYLPLDTAGAQATRLCAFARTGADATVLVVAPRLIARMVDELGAPLGEAAWSDTTLVLSDALRGRYRNVFTGEELECGTAVGLPVARVLARFPVAILQRTDTMPR
jgi:(1->4)-alpha-D-glucan 1-alpha-D-glucosylmutase